MPQHKSAEKRVKTNEKSKRRNINYKTQMKSSVKKLRNITDKELEAIIDYVANLK